jgi:hypothetical protein
MKSTPFSAAALAAAILIAPGIAGAQSTKKSSATVTEKSSATVAAPSGGTTTAAASEIAKPQSRVDPAQLQAGETARGYDAQALRIESHWGDFRIIRGAEGPVLGTVGLFRSYDVEKLVAQSPLALAQARVYQANKAPGSIVGIAGIATVLTGIVVAGNSANNASSPILIIAGGGAMLWSARHLHDAYAALSRAVWWYNRDLVR